MQSYTVARIAELVGATFQGDGAHVISGIAPLETAGDDTISFLANPRYAARLAGSRAGCIIVSSSVAESLPHRTFLVAGNPYYMFAKVSQLFFIPEPTPPGIDSHAFLEEDVTIGTDASIFPFVYICQGARIGDRVTLYPGCFVGRGSSIGDDSLIYPNVTIRERVSIGKRVIIHSATVIGSDGYGFATESGIHHKIPQIGDVIIEDDVEIGAGGTIDRGTIGPTIIGKGTKLDNQVHIAHNVTVGEHCLLVAQVGISGSTKVGNSVTIAGQSGLIGHITVGDNAIIGAGSAVTKSVPAKSIVSGIFPARDHSQSKRITASLSRLPELLTRVRKLEALLGMKEENGGISAPDREQRQEKRDE